MSMKSLIEIDHNALDKISKDPAGFADLLTRVLGGGYREQDDREDLWDYGVRFAGMQHSSAQWTQRNLDRLP